LFLHLHPQDVSLVVDICRQSVYFDAVLGIRECLEIVVHSHRFLSEILVVHIDVLQANDKDVVLERLKNRLDPAYDASDSAGYRRCTKSVTQASRLHSSCIRFFASRVDLAFATSVREFAKVHSPRRYGADGIAARPVC